MTTYLITGGTGFAARNTLPYLLNGHGNTVITVNRSNVASNGCQSHIPVNGIDIVEDEKKLKEIVKRYNPEYILHSAGQSSVLSDGLYRTNVLGTQNVLEAARSSDNLKKVLFYSTILVYPASDGLINESVPLHSPNKLNPDKITYSDSKLLGEEIVKFYAQSKGVPVTTARFANLYGSHQQPKALIPIVINKLLNREKIILDGGGVALKDWLHFPTDGVEATRVLLENGEVGEIYNVSSGGKHVKSVRAVVETIFKDLKEKLNLEQMIDYIQIGPERPGQQFGGALFCNEKIKRLGFEPATAFETGVKHTVNWFRAVCRR